VQVRWIKFRDISKPSQSKISIFITESRMIVCSLKPQEFCLYAPTRDRVRRIGLVG
jgi:hypothetical protein